VTLTQTPPPLASRILVVGGGGSSQNASDGYNEFASGGGGGGATNEILYYELIAGQTYTAHVGKGGMRWFNNQLLPYLSGEASYFGVLDEDPILFSAGGNTSGCDPCGPVNPVAPCSSGGGSCSYFSPTPGTTLTVGGTGLLISNNVEVWGIMAGGGGVGGGGSASLTKNSVGNKLAIKAGDGGSGVYSVIANRFFGGGGGGGATSASYYGTPATVTQGVGGYGGAGSGSIQQLYPNGNPIPFDCTETNSLYTCPEQNSGSGAGGVAGPYVQPVSGADGLVLLQVPADKYTGLVTGEVQITDIFLEGTLMKQIKFLGSGTYTA
jgi:hypothetical protein